MPESLLQQIIEPSENSKTKIQQIWFMQQQINNRLSNDFAEEKCIFLVGDTNVGKTTLLYYLSGLELNLIEDKMKKTREMLPKEVFQNAQVQKTCSTTEIPNVFTRQDSPCNISLIDLPGMNDSRLLNLVCNVFTFELVFNRMQNIKNIHICFVISQQMFSAQELKESLREFTEHFNVNIFLEKKSLSIIFTKTQSNDEDVKQLFLEYLQLIKQQLEEEELETVGSFVELLQNLIQNEEITYFFPKLQPKQEQGEKITQLIVRRDEFVENKKITILNPNLFRNVLQSSKHKFPSFENTLNTILEQTQTITQKSLRFAIKLTKLIHKSVALNLFNSQKQYLEQQAIFAGEFAAFLDSFIIPKQIQRISSTYLNQIVGLLSQKISSEQQLYQIDAYINMILNLTTEQNNEQQQQKLRISFFLLFTKHLHKIFHSFSILIEKASKIKEAMTEISNFFSWVSSIWLQSFANLEFNSKIKEKLQIISLEINSFQQNELNKLAIDEVFYKKIDQFAKKEVKKNQSLEQSEQESEAHIGSVVTINELKKKFYNTDQSQKSLQRLLRTKQEQCERAHKQSDSEKLIAVLQPQIKVLKQDIEHFNNLFQQTGGSSFPEQKLQFMFFKLEKISHRLLLQSFLNNLVSYFKFFLCLVEIAKQKTAKGKVIRVFHNFIDNICSIFDLYELYEEQILFYFLVDKIEKAANVLKKGVQTGKITSLVHDQFIELLKLLSKKENFHQQKKEAFKEIITVCYNFKIARMSKSRKQQIIFQAQLQNELNFFQKLPSVLKSQNLQTEIEINTEVFESEMLKVPRTIEKIKSIQERNKNCKIEEIREKFLVQAGKNY